MKEREKDRIDGTGGRRRKQLLDGLKARTEYFTLKQEVAERTWWRIRFGRGNGPVIKTDNGMTMNYIESSKTMAGFHEIFQCGKGFHK
jgi:hypothetical protein